MVSEQEHAECEWMLYATTEQWYQSRNTLHVNVCYMPPQSKADPNKSLGLHVGALVISPSHLKGLL